jgi:hypothetical protein
MEQLSRALGFERIIGSENFDASAQLASRRLTDLGALTGQLQFNFLDGDAGSIPVVSELNRLIPLTQLASTDINSGVMHARIGEGELQIQDLLLNSEAFWLAARGGASLRNGNLDLQGVLQTGGGLEAQISQNSVRNLAGVALPQLMIVSQLDNLLRNRTVYFRVRGTNNRPVIQPKVAPTLARLLLQEVRRELLIVPGITTASLLPAAED